MILDLLLFAVSAFFITFYFIPVTIRIANKYDIHDYPDDRKKHFRKVPFLGGISFMLAYSISLALCWSQPFQRPENYHYIFISLLMMAFIGLGDDLLNFKPTKKLLFQLLAGMLLIYKGNFYLPMDQIFPGLTVPLYINYAFTLLFIGGITNAYNLIDGSDGLASSIGILISLAYTYIFFASGQFFYSAMAITMAGALFAFFLYNKPPAHIFMGDAGSLFLGMMFAIFSIYFIQKGGSFTAYPINTRLILTFSLLSMPIMDMLRLFVVRIYNKKGPFTGDNNHIHHLLQQLGYTPIQVVFWVLLLQVALIGVALIAGNKNWLGFVLICVCLYGIVIQSLRQLITYKSKLDHFKLRKLYQVGEENEEDEEDIPAHAN